MIPSGYFDRRDTPAKNSPIARIMRELDVIYSESPAEELRAMANRRIHSNGPGNVKWSKEESIALRNAGVFPVNRQGARLSSPAKVASPETPTETLEPAL